MDEMETTLNGEHAKQSGKEIAGEVGAAVSGPEEAVRLIRMRFAPWAVGGLALAAGTIKIRGAEMRLSLDSDGTWACLPGAPFAPVLVEDREVAEHIQTCDLMHNLIRSASRLLSSMDMLVSDIQTHESDAEGVLRYYLDHEDEAFAYMFSRGEGMGLYEFPRKDSAFPVPPEPEGHQRTRSV